MSVARHHNEWLSLVPVSGPFLSMPVLMRVLPQGLDGHEPEHFRTLRLAHEEWSDGRTNPAIHKAWIKFVLSNTLELPDEVIDEGQAIMLQATISEHGEMLRPDYVVKNPFGVANAGKPRLLVCAYPPTQSLERPVAGRRWKASPDTRMMELLHRTNSRIGLVTNGEHWMLVDAPAGETTGYASWYADLWLDENITLRAFRSLLGVRRLFSVPAADTVERMLAESAANQQEVTDQLGYQVRKAVEVLVQSLDRADQDRGGTLLRNISDEELYEAALTVMMRLVFLFSAEERDLLPLDDPLYNQNYAVSTLRATLREVADEQTEDVLERRRDAWSRLLSTFRAVYGGIQHERLSLLAYGGGLFDPDRFPFLEGRGLRTQWRNEPAVPLPVNNRTVLHLLEALQILQVKVPGVGHAEARLLSFRALDIEQIGHVYEGLLDHTAKRAPETVLGFAGGKDKEPEVALSQLEELRAKGEDELLDWLKSETGRTTSSLKKALSALSAIEHSNRCKVACGGDELWKRVQPFANLIRTDTLGRPVIIREGSVFVTAGTDRRTSGTHYTPRSLTEPIVEYTLEPLVYRGPAEGKPEPEWTLRSPTEILNLKICDMACGSGAFLVQACRYVSELLVEGWEDIEQANPHVVRITPDGKTSKGEVGEQLVPTDTQERLVFARRLVAGRCLYGVDANPLAAEMAKLSLWLLTLAKDKPFEFLDHAVRCGDSLVGLHDLDQLRYFSLKADASDAVLFKGPLENAVDEAIALRLKLEGASSNTVEDVEVQEKLLHDADEKMARLRCAADLLVASELWGENSKDEKERAYQTAAIAERHVEHGPTKEFQLLAANERRGQNTFHWPLEFPEVFDRGGFDAFLGNPPFLRGHLISKLYGDHYRDHLTTVVVGGTAGLADIVAYFCRRAWSLLSDTGAIGMLATNSISEGDSRRVALDAPIKNGSTIIAAYPNHAWPGNAAVIVSYVVMTRRSWKGKARLRGAPVNVISSGLSEHLDLSPHKLAANSKSCFVGSYVLGDGFVLTSDESMNWCQRDPTNEEVILPYMNGVELFSFPDCSPTRFVICFWDWPESRCRQWKAAFDRISAEVKPIRDETSRDRYRKMWWTHAENRPGLYHAVGLGQHFRKHPSDWSSKVKCPSQVICRAKTSNTWAFCFLPARMIFDQALTIIADERRSVFSIVQSTIHETWARESGSGSTMKSDLRYAPSTFATFPFPPTNDALERLGQRYIDRRGQSMLTRGEGLTKTYRRFHDSAEASDDIQQLRQLHIEVDDAVAAAYGWNNLPLGHGFHETKQGLRFTISEASRREVLQRLLMLNHERYAEEVKQDRHSRKVRASVGGKRGKTRRAGTQLFD